ncbi:MAG: zinc ribbon domain-containing protein [Clostridia bacterium]|nr:zinc ribbon domain-containing protein [Clostridia bacterium]
MFCKNCGKQLPDDAQFCDGCGQPTGAVKPASAGMPPFVKSFLDQLKALVNPTQAIGLAAQSTGFEGVIGVGLYWIIFALFNALVMDNEFLNFGALFGLSLVTGLLYLGFTYGAIYLISFLSAGKAPNPFTALNVLGLALIPTCVANLVNMGFHFAWWGLESFVSDVAYIFLILILYVAIQKMGKPVRSYFWIFCAVLALAFVLSAIFSDLILGAYTENVYSNPFGDLGDYSDLGDLFY